MHPYIRWFDDLGLDDVPIVGGKNASLGELYRTLAAAGVRVPNGYADTADACRHFIGPVHGEPCRADRRRFDDPRHG